MQTGRHVEIVTNTGVQTVCGNGTCPTTTYTSTRRRDSVWRTPVRFPTEAHVRFCVTRPLVRSFIHKMLDWRRVEICWQLYMRNTSFIWVLIRSISAGGIPSRHRYVTQRRGPLVRLERKGKCVKTERLRFRTNHRSSNFVTCCATMSVGDHNVSLLNYIEYLMKKKENAGMHRTGSILNTVVSITREFLFKRNKRIKLKTTDGNDLPLPRTFTKETP